jgi:hypothetical protein
MGSNGADCGDGWQICHADFRLLAGCAQECVGANPPDLRGFDTHCGADFAGRIVGPIRVAVLALETPCPFA